MMVQNISGRELVRFDPANMSVTSEFSLVDIGVDEPISTSGAFNMAVLDRSSRDMVLVSNSNQAFITRSVWGESGLVDFDPRELFYSEFGTRYCVHELGVSSFNSFQLTPLVTISPEHLQSPRSMLIRAMNQPIPADFNGDGFIDGLDLSMLLGEFGSEGDSDLTGDGLVDGADLARLLGLWTNSEDP
jgi:hypothetical protein